METVDGHQPQSPGLWFQSFCTKHLGHPCKAEMDVKYQPVGCWCVETRDGATVLVPAALDNCVLDGGQAASGRVGFMVDITFHMLTLKQEGSGNNAIYERCVCSHSALPWQNAWQRTLNRKKCLFGLTDFSPGWLVSLSPGFGWGRSITAERVWRGKLLTSWLPGSGEIEKGVGERTRSIVHRQLCPPWILHVITMVPAIDGSSPQYSTRSPVSNQASNTGAHRMLLLLRLSVSSDDRPSGLCLYANFLL